MLELHVRKRLGHFQLTVDLEADREVLVLFGPSGAGKTQTLNMIAGITQPDSGTISSGGKVMFRTEPPQVNLPPRERQIGYVFQSNTLFPHLTVLENMVFALEDRQEAKHRGGELLQKFGLTPFANRYPGQLSGGQQQRVAMARAIASRPPTLLLDEPFSALDRRVRDELTAELRQLQADLGLTVLYVTHSLDDAFALGHRIAVMADGAVQQVGTTDAIITRPASDRVLEVLGAQNVFRATVKSEGNEIDWNGITLKTATTVAVAAGTAVTAFIRPEEVRILYTDRPSADALRVNVLQGRVVARRPSAASIVLTVELENQAYLDVSFSRVSYSLMDLSPGASVRLSIRPEAVNLLGEHSQIARDDIAPSSIRA